jgi:CheY-like chemotaxis protein/chemotaxis signal transduction protein
MSLPHLLLVDDSDAIIAFERAALGNHYVVSAASNGKEAFEKASQIIPDAILLDLSMPVMGGDEVLRHLKADPILKAIPVIIISSEKDRAEQCLSAGATAFLEKPLRADTLVTLVGKVLNDRRQKEREGSVAVLFVKAGDLEVGIPLEGIRGVLDQPATMPVPAAPPYLSRYFEFHGEAVLVLDLPQRLGVAHSVPVLHRKLVVVSENGVSVAASVDGVTDPEEFQRSEVVPRGSLAGPGVTELSALRAMVRTSRGHLPVLETRAILNAAVLDDVRNLTTRISSGPADAGGVA